MGATIAALLVGFGLVALMLLVIRVTNALPDVWDGEMHDIPRETRLDIYVGDQTHRRDVSEQDTQELDALHDGIVTIADIELPSRAEYPRPVVGILDPLAYVTPWDMTATPMLGQRAPARVRLYPYCHACYAADGMAPPRYGLPRLCVSHQNTMILPIQPLQPHTADERKHA